MKPLLTILIVILAASPAVAQYSPREISKAWQKERSKIRRITTSPNRKEAIRLATSYGKRIRAARGTAKYRLMSEGTERLKALRLGESPGRPGGAPGGASSGRKPPRKGNPYGKLDRESRRLMEETKRAHSYIEQQRLEALVRQ